MKQKKTHSKFFNKILLSECLNTTVGILLSKRTWCDFTGPCITLFDLLA
jgi:hypothetical protein